MAKAIPSTEPTEITAGETVKWTVDPADFPLSEGWTLTYHIRGAAQLDVVCTDNTENYLATVTATQSAALNTGTATSRYWWRLLATKDAEVYAVASGEFDVLPSLADIEATYDGRTHAKKVLDAIDALLESKASKDQKSMMVGDRQVSRLSPKELLEWRAVYQAKYDAEQAELGNKASGRVLAEFVGAS